MNDRVKRALEILKKYKDTEYYYLGEGWEGVIFRDSNYVYKVFVPRAGRPEDIDDWKFAFLKAKAGKFINRKHLINYEFLELNKYVKAIRYPFYPFENVRYIEYDEAISFLSECWKEKIVFRDVKKSNFIRGDGILKYVDYGFNGDFAPYRDNSFQNIAARLFIDVKYPDMEEKRKYVLKRSTINNFNIPELDGFHQFLNKVFSNIIYEESKKAVERYNHKKKVISDVSSNRDVISLIKEKRRKINNSLEITIRDFEGINFEQIFWGLLKYGIRLEKVYPYKIHLDEYGYHTPKGYTLICWKLKPLAPKVTLLIKACPRESKTLYQQVKHIIKQLMAPSLFYEKVIAIDKKENNFLRQYTTEGSLDELYTVIEKLIKEGIIDYHIELPENKVEEVNYKWFRLKTKETHTINNIPVTPQIYAFEKVNGEYILQLDSDVIIGRVDYKHSFLKDMIKALEENENAISVGFNIPKDKNVKFLKYHAPSGGYKPEVRFSLIHKERLLKTRPWPNELIDGKLKWGWYQSLHRYQKMMNYVSLRGGDSRSYYIHPQNYRKSCMDLWFTIVDRIENNIIPEIQREKFDLEGSYYDWTIPKRNEKFIIVTLLRNVEYACFLRTWNSIISQEYDDFGWIIIDDVSENGIGILIDSLISMFGVKDRVIFIKNRFRQGIAANTYKAIHYFINNPNSVVVIVDGDDALIGNDVLRHLHRKYHDFNADVVIGKMYRTDKLWAHYLYTPNFYNPRLYNNNNVWQNLRSFKKYLFDSINLYELREIKSYKDIKSANIGERWIEYCVDYAYMIPIVEMSENPNFIEIYNYYHERSTRNTPEIRRMKDKIIKDILSRPAYSPKNVIHGGRIDFIPNLNKIEIDITYDCNFKCLSCNRSCTQAPSKNDYMTVEQIKKFIEENIELNKKWELINILGGEPTLHPDFFTIVNLILNEYILKFSPQTVLQITSNGYSPETREKLDKLPKLKDIAIDKYSFKNTKKVEYFTQFNLAPVDTEEYRDKDFSKGCWVTSYCGIGLNKYGYYPCGVAGAMDRVMGFDVGIKSLREVTVERLKGLLYIFCRYSGNFVDYDKNYGNFIPRCEKSPFTKPIITKTWREIYRNYHKKRPKLTPIYER